jgi:hypothetical protein
VAASQLPSTSPARLPEPTGSLFRCTTTVRSKRISKSHVVQVTITNASTVPLDFVHAWFKHGRLADQASWPAAIPAGATAAVECYESDGSLLGCSGWVCYSLGGRAQFYFCFSNPAAGYNGIELGTDPAVWDGMGGHYMPIDRNFPYPGNGWCSFRINSTAGDENTASYQLTMPDVTTITPANQEVTSAAEVFDALDGTKASRRYYECDAAPTDFVGIATSHFKGISVYRDKLILTHTDLDGTNGKYLIADGLRNEPRGSTEGTFDTDPATWLHPGGSQACGSFMAMGVQAAVDSTTSDVIVLDIRNAAADQPLTVLGRIPRTQGVNGVGITKEAGTDGHYIVVAGNSTSVDFYRSTTSALITGGVPTAEFIPLFSAELPGDSGAGLALVTEAGGQIYLFTLNAADTGADNTLGLYRVDIQPGSQACTPVRPLKPITVPDMSPVVTELEKVLNELPAALAAVLAALLKKYGASYLNSSFRWGKGLSVDGPATITLFASDRNVIPLSEFSLLAGFYDFSTVVWGGEAAVSSPQ